VAIESVGQPFRKPGSGVPKRFSEAMMSVIQTSPAPGLYNPFLSRLSRRLSIRLALSLFTLALAVVTGARSVRLGLASDPFNPYEKLMPGTPTEGLAAFHCQTSSQPSAGPMANTAQTPCSIIPPNGSLFHLVTVGVHHETISEVTFYSSYLQIDELMRHWGNPDSTLRSDDRQSFTFRWNRDGYKAVAVMSPPLGSTVVRLVRLTGT
jgi:hypothetical protein